MNNSAEKHAHRERVERLRRAVGDCLTAAMARAKISPEQLIKKAGIAELTKSTVSLYRNGKVLPGLDRLKLLLEVCKEQVTEDIELAYSESSNEHMAQLRGSASVKEFVLAWQNSETVSEVAAKLGLSYIAAYQRSRHLRGKGVNLKQMKRHGLIDADELNAMIEKHATEGNSHEAE